MATVQHSLQSVQSWEEDPEKVEGGAEEVGKEGEHRERVDDEEELGVWYDALVEQSVDVAVEEGVEDAGDGGVGGEECDEEDGGHDLRCSSVEIGVVAAAAVAECLSNLMEVPEIVRITFGIISDLLT